MTEARVIAGHTSRIIAALERVWAAIQGQYREIPDVVIITRAGSDQKGTPEGYRLRGHHWPERWILGAENGQRAAGPGRVAGICTTGAAGRAAVGAAVP